jgi:hypothetical protein
MFGAAQSQEQPRANIGLERPSHATETEPP